MVGIFRRGVVKPSVDRFPVVDDHFQSNIPGLYVIGDLTGQPLVKIALNQGVECVQHICETTQLDEAEGDYDLVIVGGGPAGLSAAIEAKRCGLKYLVLEKDRCASTLRNFPKGKIIYAEPESLESKSPLFAETADATEFVARWNRTLAAEDLNIHECEEVTDIRRGSGFEVVTPQAKYTAKRVLLAIGKQGNPRKLGVPGEDLDKVYSALYEPQHWQGSKVLIVGGGNTAAEAALALADANEVTVSYRRDEFTRLKRQNQDLIEEAIEEGAIEVIWNSNVTEIREDSVELEVAGETRTIENDVVFVLIGTELPVRFLRKVGLTLEYDWTWQRIALSATVVVLALGFYIFKQKPGWWPWYEETRPWTAPGFYFGYAYSAVVLVLGLYYMRNRARYIQWRNASCIFFQVIIFTAIPLFLISIEQTQVGRNFTRFVYAWPLQHRSLDPVGQAWIGWLIVSAAVAFVAIPLFVYFHGQRYCAWICGCGALAETLGEPFRRLAPKGDEAKAWEKMGYVVLAFGVLATGLMWIQGWQHHGAARAAYGIVVAWLMAGALGVGLYPIFGGRVWCRYWCPLRRIMNDLGKLRGNRSRIWSTPGLCIDCGICNRNCEMGIDIKYYALKGEQFTLRGECCIACGECVERCPVQCLHHAEETEEEARAREPMAAQPSQSP
ncbi:MAG: NAD(P)-binding domain-containing protein [Armatimonadota bacterium]